MVFFMISVRRRNMPVVRKNEGLRIPQKKTPTHAHPHLYRNENENEKYEEYTKAISFWFTFHLWVDISFMFKTFTKKV